MTTCAWRDCPNTAAQHGVCTKHHRRTLAAGHRSSTGVKRGQVLAALRRYTERDAQIASLAEAKKRATAALRAGYPSLAAAEKAARDAGHSETAQKLSAAIWQEKKAA